MPVSSKAASQPQPVPPPQTAFPTIESFVERASVQDVDALFAPLRDGLSALKGPKADQAKKVAAAIERTEELLKYLLDTRGKLEADKKGKRR